MKKIIIFALTSLIIGQTFAEESSHNEHSKHSKSDLTLNNGQKWEVDQVMNKNMSAIIKEKKKVTDLMISTKVKKEDYNKLSDLIATATQDIAKNCKMGPKADQTFHAILADLILVSEHLKESKTPNHAMKKLEYALQTYNQYFNHPISK